MISPTLKDSPTTLALSIGPHFSIDCNARNNLRCFTRSVSNRINDSKLDTNVLLSNTTTCYHSRVEPDTLHFVEINTHRSQVFLSKQDTIRPTFGTLLRQLRVRSGITQRVLASTIGVNVTYISKLETGAVESPAARVIGAISQALNVPPLDLMISAGRLPKEFIELILSNSNIISLIQEAIEYDLNDTQWELLFRLLRKFGHANADID